MNKKWRLSDSGLQVYEGNKHIATAHYGGNPVVDINEAIENATIIRQAPALLDRLAALRARVTELEEALTDLYNVCQRDGLWEQIPVNIQSAVLATLKEKE